MYLNPETEPLQKDTFYYIAHTPTENYLWDVRCSLWVGSKEDLVHLNKGVVHKSRLNAILHSQFLKKTKGE